MTFGRAGGRCRSQAPHFASPRRVRAFATGAASRTVPSSFFQSPMFSPPSGTSVGAHAAAQFRGGDDGDAHDSDCAQSQQTSLISSCSVTTESTEASSSLATLPDTTFGRRLSKQNFRSERQTRAEQRGSCHVAGKLFLACLLLNVCALYEALSRQADGAAPRQEDGLQQLAVKFLATAILVLTFEMLPALTVIFWPHLRRRTAVVLGQHCDAPRGSVCWSAPLLKSAVHITMLIWLMSSQWEILSAILQFRHHRRFSSDNSDAMWTNVGEKYAALSFAFGKQNGHAEAGGTAEPKNDYANHVDEDDDSFLPFDWPLFASNFGFWTCIVFLVQLLIVPLKCVQSNLCRVKLIAAVIAVVAIHAWLLQHCHVKLSYGSIFDLNWTALMAADWSGTVGWMWSISQSVLASSPLLICLSMSNGGDRSTHHCSESARCRSRLVLELLLCTLTRYLVLILPSWLVITPPPAESASASAEWVQRNASLTRLVVVGVKALSVTALMLSGAHSHLTAQPDCHQHLSCSPAVKMCAKSVPNKVGYRAVAKSSAGKVVATLKFMGAISVGSAVLLWISDAGANGRSHEDVASWSAGAGVPQLSPLCLIHFREDASLVGENVASLIAAPPCLVSAVPLMLAVSIVAWLLFALICCLRQCCSSRQSCDLSRRSTVCRASCSARVEHIKQLLTAIALLALVSILLLYIGRLIWIAVEAALSGGSLHVKSSLFSSALVIYVILQIPAHLAWSFCNSRFGR